MDGSWQKYNLFSEGNDDNKTETLNTFESDNYFSRNSMHTETI